MGTKTSRLETIRLRLGLNKTDFAKAMGITSHYYYNILRESGTSNLRLEHLESLLLNYRVSPAWVLTGEGDMFLPKGEELPTEWVAGTVVPDIPVTATVDEGLLGYLVKEVINYSGVPLVREDLAYPLLVRFGRYYIYKNPGETAESLDIPALCASFLVLLQTVQSMIDTVFEMQSDGTVTLSFEGQLYRFRHLPQPAK